MTFDVYTEFLHVYYKTRSFKT